MILTCPHCAKSMSISPEELAITNAVVVCPQCLTEFIAEGVDLPEASTLRQQHSSGAGHSHDGHAHVNERFCYGCGQELPQHDGLRFCPFCGVPLLANPLSGVHKTPQESATRLPGTSSIDSATSATSSTVNEQIATDKTQHKAAKSSSNAYRYVPKVFSKELRPEPPSFRFKLLAYSIITILVVIFVIIVYLGSQI